MAAPEIGSEHLSWFDRMPSPPTLFIIFQENMVSETLEEHKCSISIG